MQNAQFIALEQENILDGSANTSDNIYMVFCILYILVIGMSIAY